MGSPICAGRHHRESVMYRYKVDKMGCGGCAKSVTRAIVGIEPDAQVAVDLAAKLVTVSGAGGPAERIAQAIAAAGYPAEPLDATA
jgi:copper chaperone